MKNVKYLYPTTYIGVVAVKQNDILLYLIGGGIFGFFLGTVPEAGISTLLGGIQAVLVAIFSQLSNILKKMEDKK
ncbi:hypothetical protein B1no1_19500 [Thermolongibacillus altinsuensis]|jgi:hypothetical protein|nr:hypothetical protein B1no1_19500 [Thermolongibacillus altinsuensis]